MINFSDDNDQEPDSEGEFTGASLTKPNMPKDFTICSAFMVEAWTTEFTASYLFAISYDPPYAQQHWGYVSISPTTHDQSKVEVRFNKVYVSLTYYVAVFPLTWIHVCVSLDTVSDVKGPKIGVVVNGMELKKKLRTTIFTEAKEDPYWPADLRVVLGYRLNPTKVEFTGIISKFNIFSFSKSIEEMVNLTKGGGEGCGAPGDYVSWEEEDWQISGRARVQMVGELEEPCRRKSEVNVYENFLYHSARPEGEGVGTDDRVTARQGGSGCMEHCQKIGHYERYMGVSKYITGRSPPVGSPQEWESLVKELQATFVTNESLPYLWLAGTDEEEEVKEIGTKSVWKDFYTKKNFTTGLPDDEQSMAMANGQWGPWFAGPVRNEYYNCLQLQVRSGRWLWTEAKCKGLNMGCPCQSKQPILNLRGMCGGRTSTVMDWMYTPKQLPTNPMDLMWVGAQSSRIYYNDSTRQWILTDARSGIMAKSNASKVSYALGKHKWEVTGDVLDCYPKGQPYTTYLKLSGCNPRGEFTCNDGQCVTIGQRCDQVHHCTDESDEKDCKLLVLAKSYNKRVPPITLNSTDASIIPVQMNISIDLMNIIDMEEQDHKIDLQFEITLEWRETDRVVYHYLLKKDESMNALTDKETSELWLPKLYYDNTDQKELTRLGAMWEWETHLSIVREGVYRMNTYDEVDETKTYKGTNNRIEMKQVYTWQFQCTYDLKLYPFDTQVKEDDGYNIQLCFPLGVHNRDDDERRVHEDGNVTAPQDEHES